MDGADGPPVELVKATMVGRGPWVVAIQVPFVHQTGTVACGTQHGGDGSVLWQQVGTSHNGGIAIGVNLQACHTTSLTHIVANAGIACIPSRHQGAARRRADA